jgi:uncharacterized alkaline shock family protein YloU
MPENSHGNRIEITQHAIATLASDAVLRCYGVVGLTSKNRIGGIADRLAPDRVGRGIDVKFSDGEVILDLYVIVQYGTRISEVAHSVMHSVKYALEQALGVPVAQVNVHIQGLRLLSDL